MTPVVEPMPALGISVPSVLVLAIALGFLIYVFTGSSRLVAGTLFFGLLVLLAAGFLGALRPPRGPHKLVELVRPRQPVNSASLGPAATTRLFDVPASGHSFVFVIDASASMGSGGAQAPLEMLKEPVKQCITHLQLNHRFQVYVFNPDTSARVPTGGAEGLAIADNPSVVQALDAIDGLTADSGPANPERFPPNNALYQALGLQPDVIYFLTDGRGTAPSRSDLDSLRRWNSSHTSLHVIQLATSPEGPKPSWLADLARQHRGVFKHAVIPAQLAAKDEKKPPQQPATSEPVPVPRPSWVTRPVKPLERTGDTYRAVVTSGFSVGEDRCRENFDTNVLAAAASYIDQVVESGAGQRVTRTPGVRERALQYLSTNVIKQRYREEVVQEFPIGEGVEQFALLEFNDQAAGFFRQEWRQILQERRLLIFAGAMALVMAFVGTIFGYLKTDTATRGYYSGRLKLGAVVVLVALAAAAVKLVMVVMA